MTKDNDKTKNEPARKLCALVIGHQKTSPGAKNAGSSMTEFEFNENLSMLIEHRVLQTDIQRVYRRTRVELLGDINALNPDFIVSLHCNSFAGDATGTEVLYYHKSSRGKMAAEILQRHLHNHLQLRDRGIKPRRSKDRGGSLLKKTIAPCLIAEPFFISNDNDLARAMSDLDGLAEAYANAIDEIGGNEEISGWKNG